MRISDGSSYVCSSDLDNPRPPSGPCPTSVNLEELLAFAGRHQLLSIALVGLTIAIIVNEVMQLFRGYKTLRPAGPTALIKRDNAPVAHLRTLADLQKGQITRSKNGTMRQLDPTTKQPH